MPSKVAEGDELEEFLLAAGRGDRAAFARLYELSAGRLYAIAMQMFGNRATADDVLQDAFVLIWRKAAQYNPERGRASAWMAGVTRNCAIDRLRAEKRGPRNAIEWNETVENLMLNLSDETIPDRHMATALATCLERLPENQRKSIVLAYNYGMTHEELAAQLESPLGTVKSWVRRGLLQLRDCLEQ